MHLRPPQPAQVELFLQQQRSLAFTYHEVGATATQPPAGYVVDHTRVRLGAGEPVFLAAKVALNRWQHFHLGWVEAWPTSTPLAAGQVIAVLARTAGVTWLNACRIVYAVDEAGPTQRFGFAYGTLPGHAESGEERFLVEWDCASDEVWYDILAFSHPRHVLARIGYPVTRLLQKRFARDSAAAMQRATTTGAAP